jgi:hypothetical protein
MSPVVLDGASPDHVDGVRSPGYAPFIPTGLAQAAAIPRAHPLGPSDPDRGLVPSSPFRPLHPQQVTPYRCPAQAQTSVPGTVDPDDAANPRSALR